MQFSAHVDGAPQPQGSKRVVRGHVIDANAQALRPWRQAVSHAVAGALPDGWPLDGAYDVGLLFTFRRPASQVLRSGALRKGARVEKTSRPDLDKLVRAVLDACTDAGAWGDDCQVVSLAAVKVYGAPGVDVSVSAR